MGSNSHDACHCCLPFYRNDCETGRGLPGIYNIAPVGAVFTDRTCLKGKKEDKLSDGFPDFVNKLTLHQCRNDCFKDGKIARDGGKTTVPGKTLQFTVRSAY